MAAIHPMVFSIKNDVKKLEERIKKLEDTLANNGNKERELG